MRHTRGWEIREERWARQLAALFVYKVAIQQDILRNKMQSEVLAKQNNRGFDKSWIRPTTGDGNLEGAWMWLAKRKGRC